MNTTEDTDQQHEDGTKMQGVSQPPERMRSNHADWALPRDLGCLFIAPIIGFLAGFLVPCISKARRGDLTMLLLSFAIALTGIVFLIVAKYPHIKGKQYFALGSAGLPERNRRIYRIAWRLIALGIGLLVLLLVLVS